MFEFSYRPQVFYVFYRGEGRNDGIPIEWGKNVDVPVLVFPPPHFLVGKSVVKLQSSEAAI